MDRNRNDTALRCGWRHSWFGIPPASADEKGVWFARAVQLAGSSRNYPEFDVIDLYEPLMTAALAKGDMQFAGSLFSEGTGKSRRFPYRIASTVLDNGAFDRRPAGMS